MKRRNRELNVFNLSAIDLFASAMGAFLIIALVLFPYFMKNSEVIARFEAEITNLSEQLNTAVRERDVAQSSLDEATQKITSLEGDVQRIATERDIISSQLKQAQQSNQELTNSLDNSQRELQKATSSLEQARMNAAKARRAITAAQEKIANLERQLEAKSRSNSAMREKLNNPFVVVIIKWNTSYTDIDLHVTTPSGNEFKHSNTRVASEPHARFEEDTTKGPGNEVWTHRKAVEGKYKVEYVYYSDNHQTIPGESRRIPPKTKINGYIIHTDGRIDLPEITLDSPDNKSKKLVGYINVDNDGKVTFTRQ